MIECAGDRIVDHIFVIADIFDRPKAFFLAQRGDDGSGFAGLFSFIVFRRGAEIGIGGGLCCLLIVLHPGDVLHHRVFFLSGSRFLFGGRAAVLQPFADVRRVRGNHFALIGEGEAAVGADVERGIEFARCEQAGGEQKQRDECAARAEYGVHRICPPAKSLRQPMAAA